MDTVLVTGASSGIGAAFARLAAEKGHPLILTARSADKLEALAEELRAKGTTVTVIPADLAQEAEVERVWTAAGHVDILVNNAGLGANGDLTQSDWERERQSIDVNVTAYTLLAKRAAAVMAARGRGRILNVASVAGFIAGPGTAVYSATKAYALSLSEALSIELRGTGVTVTALCPGATRTGFFEAAGMDEASAAKMRRMPSAEEVAELGYQAVMKGRRVAVHGLVNRVGLMASRGLPRSTLPNLIRRMRT